MHSHISNLAMNAFIDLKWLEQGLDLVLMIIKIFVKVKMEEDSCVQTKHPSLKPQTSTIIVFYNKLHEKIAFLLFLKENCDSCEVNKV